MGIGWAYCPICEKVFEGSYFPDTGVNTAEHMVERHTILRHHKKITDNGIVDAKAPDDFIRASEMKTYFAGGTGNIHLKGSAYITCVCGRYFDINFEEFYYNGKNVRIRVREFDDIGMYRKISENTEVIYVGYTDVHKFEKLWKRTWERVRENIIRSHLGEHGIMGAEVESSD